jgi:CHAD domain-containing protein
MNQGKIDTIVRLHVHKLAKLAEKINRDFDEEAIHNFRVTIKSLRAFLRLIAAATGNRKIKITARINRLYHILGGIRDAEQERSERVNSGFLFPAYFELLDANINRGKANWERHYTGKEFHRFQEKIGCFELTKMEPSILLEYFNIKIKRIKKLSKETVITDKELHEIRKLLKDMYYVMEIITQNWPTGSKHIKILPVEKINELTTEIGNYNDKRLRLEHLTAFVETYTDVKEKHTILALCSVEMLSLAGNKKRVLGLIRGFLEDIKQHYP